ncbi:hypothetical protein BC936DRAFT_143035 [Jimgerdemannia flammicorona]|uniref:Uncharacterized protein n=1 Tax=Jimgerdemannia flammicorona TaxID=994334 RepID=A0A432ZZE7_9FUNG|nr:hypothetical protein BC936DRAFT_143035 [Jimgerdemannia flammicorona]
MTGNNGCRGVLEIRANFGQNDFSSAPAKEDDQHRRPQDRNTIPCNIAKRSGSFINHWSQTRGILFSLKMSDDCSTSSTSSSDFSDSPEGFKVTRNRKTTKKLKYLLPTNATELNRLDNQHYLLRFEACPIEKPPGGEQLGRCRI